MRSNWLFYLIARAAQTVRRDCHGVPNVEKSKGLKEFRLRFAMRPWTVASGIARK